MSTNTIFAFLGPSGVGKTTLCREVCESLDGVEIAVSTTTREPREGEVDGVDYDFISREEAERGVEAGEYIEHVTYHDNIYGYRADTFTQPLGRDHDVFVVIERHGLGQLRDYFEGEVEVFAMLVLPPDLAALAPRLEAGGRGPEQIQKRLETAADEMFTGWGDFDTLVINSDLSHTVGQITDLVQIKRRRDRWAAEHV